MRSEEEYPQRVTLPIERPQLVVSEENSCDSNATTIAIDDRDILEWNDDQDESTLPYSVTKGAMTMMNRPYRIRSMMVRDSCRLWKLFG